MLKAGKISLLQVLLVNFIYLNVNGEVGDKCFNKAKQSDGSCLGISNCPEAIEDLKKRIPPQLCGFIGDVSLVCCVSSTTVTPTPKPVINTRTPGEKSKQKCKHYADLAYITERPPTLIPGQQFTKRSICPWLAEVNPVIIDGEPAKLGEFSHMALLGYQSGNGITWECGGSLISEDFVITAAHCLYSRTYGEPVVVRLGDLNYTNPDDDTYAQQIPIDRFYEHPAYKPPENYNDVALLKLTRPAKLGPYLKPICLYTDQDTTKLDKVLVTGWGHTEYGGDKSDLLMKAALDVFSTSQCNKTYKRDRGTLPRGIDEKVQMCAGSLTDRKDTCQGDSGGPIQIRSSDVHCSYYLLGVTSFGKQCGVQSIPAVYATVAPHLKWIENIVWP